MRPLVWTELWGLTVSPWEMILRGTVLYLLLFVSLRLVLKRRFGTFGLSDLLLIVLLADAAQSGMAGQYKSITDGLILIATLIFWNYFLDFLGHRYKFVEYFVHPPPLKLIENGRLLRRHLRQEFITMDELMSKLRECGVEQIEQVKVAYIEGDGEISVIPKERVA